MDDEDCIRLKTKYGRLGVGIAVALRLHCKLRLVMKDMESWYSARATFSNKFHLQAEIIETFLGCKFPRLLWVKTQSSERAASLQLSASQLNKRRTIATNESAAITSQYHPQVTRAL